MMSNTYMLHGAGKVILKLSQRTNMEEAGYEAFILSSLISPVRTKDVLLTLQLN